MVFQKTMRLRTRGRGTTDITAEVARVVAASGMAKGLCNVFLQHTSASLILCENADPDVRRDLETPHCLHHHAHFALWRCLDCMTRL